MEGLIRLIAMAKRQGRLLGPSILQTSAFSPTSSLLMTCLSFSMEAFGTPLYSDILFLFSTATGMEPNRLKIHYHSLSLHSTGSSACTSKIPISELDDGLKYLGFQTKPHSYKIADWIWLVAKVKKGLLNWNHRFLSKAGR